MPGPLELGVSYPGYEQAQGSTTPVTPPSFSNAYSALVVSDGAQYYWPLEEKQSGVVLDTISGNNGTMSGGVAVGNGVGAVGQGMYFNGTGKILLNAPVNLPASFSIEVWINTGMSGGPMGQMPFFSSYDSVNSVYVGYYIGVGDNLAPSGSFVYSPDASPLAIYGSISLADSVWHHVVYVVTLANVKIYIDGALHKTGAWTKSTVSNGQYSAIGWDKPTGNFWTGWIDELAIYPIALTAEQILNHYVAAPRKPRLKLQMLPYGGYRGAVLATPGVQSFYRFGDIEGYNQAIISNDNLAGYWILSGNAKNSSPYSGSDGTVNGTIGWGAGSIIAGFTCAYFSSAGSITAPINFTGAKWTVICWYATWVDANVYRLLVSMGTGTGTNFQFAIAPNSNSVYAYSELIPGYFYNGTEGSVNGQWHLGIVTCDGTQTRTYIDGVLKGTSSNIFTIASGTTMTIGGMNTTEYYFSGYLAGVCVMGHSVTDTYAAYLMQTSWDPILNQALSWSTITDRVGGKTGYKAGGVCLQQPSSQPDYNHSTLFDGNIDGSSYIQMTANPPPSFALNTSWSVDFWMYFVGANSVYGNDGGFVASDSGGQGILVLTEHSWYGSGSTTNMLVGLALSSASFPSTTVIQPNQWYHIAFVSLWNNLTLYINGVVDKTFGYPISATWGVSMFGKDPGNTRMFKGYLDEFATYNVALTAQDIANRFASRAWQDITTDVTGEIRWSKGMQSNRPDEVTAATGNLDFALRNDENNSAKTRRYYSPNSPNCRPGFTFGVPVRVIVFDGIKDNMRWFGKLHTIQPSSGKWGDRLTKVSAVDYFDDLAEADIHSVPPQLNVSEVTLLQKVYAAMQEDSIPPAGASYDTALDTYPYAFDDVSSGVKALYAINQVMTSARGLFYQNRNGVHVYVNRQTLQAKQSMHVFTDSHGLSVPASLDSVFNRVRATLHIRTLGAAGAVLFAASGRLQVTPGATVEVFGDYSDPNAKNLRLIGGTAFITPLVAGTDYSAWDAQNGGNDFTAYARVVVYAFAASAKFTITNTHSSTPIWVQYQIRGTGIYDNAPTSYDAFTPMPYGDRLLEIDFMYQANQAVAQDMVKLIQNQTINLANQIETMDLVPIVKPEWLVYCLGSEISDVLTISDDQTGVEAAVVYVYGIEESFDADGHYHVQLSLAPRGAGSGPVTFIFDDPQHGLFDSMQSLLGFG